LLSLPAKKAQIDDLWVIVLYSSSGPDRKVKGKGKGRGGPATKEKAEPIEEEDDPSGY